MDLATGSILLVDDEPALLKMMSLYLGRLGYSVTTAHTTDEAWSSVEASPGGYEIAVLDATMAGMSMQELASRILSSSPNARVLAASGYPVDMTYLEAAAPGRVSFLHKPFTPEMLAAAVRRMLGGEKTV